MPTDDFDDEWEEDQEGDEEDDLLECPSCRQAVHEDAQQCPHCGDWIIPVHPGERARRFVWVMVVTALIGGLIAMIVR